MAEAAICSPSTQRFAVVTGANKGIGFEICKQLASKGMTVVLTARSEERGSEALERLHGNLGLSGKVFFHQVDILDPSTIASLAEFIRAKFGRLDILVNNAGIAGLVVEGDALILQEQILEDVALVFGHEKPNSDHLKPRGKLVETLQMAEECIQTNYYGAKMVTKALVPLLKLSDLPKVVNVSSTLGNLKLLCNEWAEGLLSNEESTEEKVDEVIEEFLKDFKEGSVGTDAWPDRIAAYKVSKAALNAYTRITAKKHPEFFVNCVCPGLARTDITCNLGGLSAAEAAENVVRVALAPDGGPSGFFFNLKSALMPF